jgi:hypothetical protein
MADIQDEIARLQVEIDNAKLAVTKAQRDERALNKDSPLVADLKAAVQAAKERLLAIEVELRKLYESRSDD